ncbi:MAG: hypothetical protein HY761_07085 [Candidatus Omnitrophica bacterium]|nr:hypothetical protein [Candidatus Omnitrophota bacterium]
MQADKQKYWVQVTNLNPPDGYKPEPARGVRGDLLKIYLFKNPPSSPFAKGGI